MNHKFWGVHFFQYLCISMHVYLEVCIYREEIIQLGVLFSSLSCFRYFIRY